MRKLMSGAGLCVASLTVAAAGEPVVIEGGQVDAPFVVTDDEDVELRGEVTVVASEGAELIVPIFQTSGDGRLTVVDPLRFEGFADDGAEIFRASGSSELFLSNGFDTGPDFTGGALALRLLLTATDSVRVVVGEPGEARSSTGGTRLDDGFRLGDDAQLELNGYRGNFTRSTAVTLADRASVVGDDVNLAASQGAALRLSGQSTGEFRDSFLNSFQASGSTSLQISNSRVSGGTNGDGDQILVTDNAVVQLRDATVDANDRGVSVSGGRLEFENTDIELDRDGREITVSDEGSIRFAGGTYGVDAGLSAFALSLRDNARGEIEGGTFLPRGVGVFSRAPTPSFFVSDTAELIVSGGLFRASEDPRIEDANDRLALFDLDGTSQLTLVGGDAPFRLNDAFVELDENGEAVVDVPAGTLEGVFANGDAFSIAFEREASTTLLLRGNPAAAPPVNPVPTPSAAVLGLLLGAGFLSRRRIGG